MDDYVPRWYEVYLRVPRESVEGGHAPPVHGFEHSSYQEFVDHPDKCATTVTHLNNRELFGFPVLGFRPHEDSGGGTVNDVPRPDVGLDHMDLEEVRMPRMVRLSEVLHQDP